MDEKATLLRYLRARRSDLLGKLDDIPAFQDQSTAAESESVDDDADGDGASDDQDGDGDGGERDDQGGEREDDDAPERDDELGEPGGRGGASQFGPQARQSGLVRGNGQRHVDQRGQSERVGPRRLAQPGLDELGEL